MIFTPASTSSSAMLWAADDGHRQDRDDDVLLVHHGPQLGVVADGQRPDPGPDALVVDVEDRHHAEAVVGEDVRGGDRRAEVAGAEQRDVVLAGGPQDLADLADQRLDVVADAALAELPEARTGHGGSGSS